MQCLLHSPAEVYDLQPYALTWNFSSIVNWAQLVLPMVAGLNITAILTKWLSPFSIFQPPAHCSQWVRKHVPFFSQTCYELLGELKSLGYGEGDRKPWWIVSGQRINLLSDPPPLSLMFCSFAYRSSWLHLLMNCFSSPPSWIPLSSQHLWYWRQVLPQKPG